MRGFYRPAARRGMTLIELLVVVAIILTVISLGYLALPSYSDRKVIYAADRIQAWLLGAKMQAKREGKATGVRIAVSNNIATSLTYIQQPDDFVQLITTQTPAVAGTCSCAGGPLVSFLSTQKITGLTGTPDQDPVLPGDYIEFHRGGAVYQIGSVPQNGLTLQISSSGPSTGGQTSYRILRAPRPLPGEEDLTLPDQVAIDFNPISTTNSTSRSQVPTRQVTTDGYTTTYYEILFSPSGNVIGNGTGQTTPFLWLSDTLDYPNVNNRALIVSVQVGSGMILVSQVASGSDPYAYTRDGRASGL